MKRRSRTGRRAHYEFLPATAAGFVLPVRFTARDGVVRITRVEFNGGDEQSYALHGEPRLVRLAQDTMLEDEQAKAVIAASSEAFFRDLSAANAWAPAPDPGKTTRDLRRRIAALPIVLEPDRPASFAAVVVPSLYQNGVPYQLAIQDASDLRWQQEVERYVALMGAAAQQPMSLIITSDAGTFAISYAKIGQ